MASLVPAIQELWNTWEIHCLILVSLFLQVFLFVVAGLWRRSPWPVLHTVLWLAYLSADSVAIFVLGHLAVHTPARELGRQLISFWAPFVLIHLGGQDTITALSRQDKELWKRHLLGLVTQVAVAGYVVAKASWPEVRLTAAMVLMFLSGCFKYAERTLCLYLASPAKLRTGALARQLETLEKLQDTKDNYGFSYLVGLGSKNESRANKMNEKLDKVSAGSWSGQLSSDDESLRDILPADSPLNDKKIVSFAADCLPGVLQTFRSRPGRCKIYEHVGAILVDFYQDLYTKNPIRKPFFLRSYAFVTECVCRQKPCQAIVCCVICCIGIGPSVLYELFQYVSTPIALVLFWYAEKGGQQDQQYPSSSTRADIIV